MDQSRVRWLAAIVGLALAVVAVGALSILALVRGDEDGSGGMLTVREVLSTEVAESNTFDGVTIKIVQARCAEDEVVTGGGFRISGESRDVELQVRIKESVAAMTGETTPNVWTAVAHAPAGIGDWSIDARAMCAKAAPVQTS